jgi:hypothetical protein
MADFWGASPAPAPAPAAGRGDGARRRRSRGGGRSRGQPQPQPAHAAARTAGLLVLPAAPEVALRVDPVSDRYCPCMATRHGLVTICGSCGKLICEREKQGGDSAELVSLCTFCGSSLDRQAAPEAAEREKDKLLHFDRTHASRTRVMDDQADYFSSSHWLSPEEIAAAEEKEEKRIQDSCRKKNVTVNFDIMGRRIMEVTDEPPAEGAGPLESQSQQDIEGVDFESLQVTESATAESEAASFMKASNLDGKAMEVYRCLRASLDKGKSGVRESLRKSATSSNRPQQRRVDHGDEVVQASESRHPQEKKKDAKSRGNRNKLKS